MRKIRLVIAEERTLFRQGLKVLLNAAPDFVVVGEAAGAEETRGVCLHAQPDILLLDAALPDGTGKDHLAVISCLRASCPRVAIVVFGEIPSAPDGKVGESARNVAFQEERRQALCLGACAYLPADIDQEELLRILRAVAATHCAQPSADAAPETDASAEDEQRSPENALPGLTQRERAVIALIAQGMCNKEVAHRLGISTQTVKNHVSHLLEKLAFADRTQLAVYAIERRLIAPPDQKPPDSA